MHKKFLLGHPCLMESNIYLEVLVENPTRCNKSFCMKQHVIQDLCDTFWNFKKWVNTFFIFHLKEKTGKKNENKKYIFFIITGNDRFFGFSLLRCIINLLEVLLLAL
jgi:hypothetical protein